MTFYLRIVGSCLLVIGCAVFGVICEYTGQCVRFVGFDRLGKVLLLIGDVVRDLGVELVVDAWPERNWK
jgi:hypothetical protein